MSLGLLREPPAGRGGTKLKAAGQHDSARALNQHAPTRHPQAAGELSVCADSALGMRDESDSGLRPEMFPGIGVLPEPATGSHVVNRGTPVAPLYSSS